MVPCFQLAFAGCILCVLLFLAFARAKTVLAIAIRPCPSFNQLHLSVFFLLFLALVVARRGDRWVLQPNNW